MRGERFHPTYRPSVTYGPAAGALAVLAGVLAALGLRRLGVRRVVVTGDSMLPSFEAGDRLVLGPVGRSRPGKVVALPDPRDARRLLIKRIRAVNGSTLEVRGDNDAASTDSRDFGPVPRTRLTGRVVYRYAPPGRTGWIPG
jgi:nickel-type superoxide dismutase maturation protease